MTQTGLSKPSKDLADPVARLAASRKEFGEYGGVNAAIECSTTFTGEEEGRGVGRLPARPHKLCQRPLAFWGPAMAPVPHFLNPPPVPAAHAAAVMHADTLPQIFAGEIGPSGGCYL